MKDAENCLKLKRGAHSRQLFEKKILESETFLRLRSFNFSGVGRERGGLISFGKILKIVTGKILNFYWVSSLKIC